MAAATPQPAQPVALEHALGAVALAGSLLVATLTASGPWYSALLILPGFLAFSHHRVLRWRRFSTWVFGILGAAGITFGFGLLLLEGGWAVHAAVAPFLFGPALAAGLLLLPRRTILVHAPTALLARARHAAFRTPLPRVRLVSAETTEAEIRGRASELRDPTAVWDGTFGRLHLHPEGPAQGMARAVQRSLDLMGSLVLLPLTMPLCFVLAVLIRVRGGGSGFYSQERITLGGAPFRIHKLRSMVVDAEPGGVAVWPEENDPRITRLGRVLRKYWLDELPQLWDVLRGSMSLVGPRPERPAFVQAFSARLPNYPLRHSVKGGMTGLAQIRGLVGNTPISRRLRHDLAYACSWSPCMDLWILLMTVIRAARRSV